MKHLSCACCAKAMASDEIALCLHLHGGAATYFLCIECLAKEFACPPDVLLHRVALLKRSGCRYFSETYV